VREGRGEAFGGWGLLLLLGGNSAVQGVLLR
jgi:hypothetical protein